MVIGKVNFKGQMTIMKSAFETVRVLKRVLEKKSVNAKKDKQRK